MVLRTGMWGEKPPKHEDLYRELQPGDTRYFQALEDRRNEQEQYNRRHVESIKDRLAKVKPPQNTGKKVRTR